MRPLVPLAALALLAGLVTGREQAPAPERTPASLSRAPQQQAPNMPELELDRLVRQPHGRSFSDLFAVPVTAPSIEPPVFLPEPVPAQAVAAAVPAPAPAAPPLPFAYLGRMVNGDRIVAYLLKGDQMHLAEAGQILGDDYRVEGITDAAVHFVYLPLGTKQVLNFPVRE